MKRLSELLSPYRLQVLGGIIVVLALFAVVRGAADTLVIGVIVGLIYGIVALGLVLIYKGSRVVNFAQGQIALLGAFAAWGFITDPDPTLPGQFIPRGLPWFLAALIGIAVAGATGVVVERTVIRRLVRAPRLIVLVATLGLGQLLTVITIVIWLRGEVEVAGFLPFPSAFKSSFPVGDVRVLGGHLLAAIVVPALALGLAAFFKLTRIGIAIRAASDNPDAARLLGVSVNRVSMISWGLGAALAGVAGILIPPVSGGLSISLLGTGLLIRALAVAILGGMTSLPGALIGGLAVGIGEALLTRFSDAGGVVEISLLVGILVMLLFFSSGEREEERLGLAVRFGRLAGWIRNHPIVGVPRVIFAYAIAITAIALPLILKPSGNFAFAMMLVFAMLGVSLNLLMGTTGQISLGHFALLGVGAFVGAKLVTQVHMPYLLAFVLAGLAGGVVAFLVGLPALRIRGLSLAIATLAFAVAAEAYLFRLDVWGGRFGLSFPRPKIGPIDLDDPSGREFSYLCLFILLAMVWMVRNLDRRRGGRALLAVRENEISAAVLGVSIQGYKLLAFTLSGVLAAWAGFLFGMLNPPVTFGSFIPRFSLDIAALVIIGGLGSWQGAIFGALYIVGIPRMFPDFDLAPLMAGGLGLLLVLMIRPGGLWSLVTGLRDFYVWAWTVEDRAFKGPLSQIVPAEVPEAARLGSLFATHEVPEDGSGKAARPRPKAQRARPR